MSTILKNFGLNATQISRPPDAMLAQVYLVEDRYILRSRNYESTTLERFIAECKLCENVAELTGFHFPKYRRALSGERYVVEGGNFWTLHKRIPGRPLGSWFNLHKIEPSITYKVVKALHRLHAMTINRFKEKAINRTHVIASVKPAFSEASNFLSSSASDRLQKAYHRVKNYCHSYSPEDSCFVHGDFHHGNILAHNGQIIGFIDLDWCRVSSPYEDIAFTLMMLLRDYQNWSHDFKWPMYQKMLDVYGFEGETSILNDYIILYALFDCAVFKSSNFENSNAFFEYQKDFLESTCNAMTAEGL